MAIDALNLVQGEVLFLGETTVHDEEFLVHEGAKWEMDEGRVNVIEHLGVVLRANLSFKVVKTIDPLLLMISTTTTVSRWGRVSLSWGVPMEEDVVGIEDLEGI